uniref:Si:ch211-236l14.4 n=1 Tax=Xiphophorus couchianus TaxID=32473 RepID=A0A3B5N1M9_9TELE
MPHARNRNPSPIPEVTWDTGLKEMNETWKGAIACLGVAVFFVMTIGIIYWQVVDQPNKNWILRGTFSGLIWERRTHSLVIQTLMEDRTYVEIDVGNVGNPDIEVPFVRNLCWLNKTEFCYTWDSVAEVKISLEASEDAETECYSMAWTPVNCHVELKDCFSMANVSWYGGANVQGQTWPINDQNITMQPYIVSNLKDSPSGYGSPLERYFLGSSGKVPLLDTHTQNKHTNRDIFSNIPVLTQWRGKFCVKLNLTNPAAVSWFLDRVESLQAHLGMEYIVLEGAEGNLFEEQALRTPLVLSGDKYIELLADMATSIGDSTIMTAGTRSSHMPLFIKMAPLQSDWSPTGLRAVIPSLLHHALVGYNFLIPDAVGGSLSGDLVTDKELFIRWLEIAAFLPVLSFHTPPWVFGEDQVLNLTRIYMTKHQTDVVPLLQKYAEEWQLTGNPIYRPLWWLSPSDPMTFTTDDQFLIGDEVLVAPIVEKGAVQRDIYLPDGGFQWQDSQSEQVFDGGTFLEDYPVPLEEVAVFLRRS